MQRQFVNKIKVCQINKMDYCMNVNYEVAGLQAAGLNLS
jgi:hypothetical protein